MGHGAWGWGHGVWGIGYSNPFEELFAVRCSLFTRNLVIGNKNI
ncbi:MAG: hypothetical protein AAFS12_00315 [Cyanobacteria bacterium J06632_19]